METMQNLRSIEAELKLLSRRFQKMQQDRIAFEQAIQAYKRNGLMDEDSIRNLHGWIDATIYKVEKDIAKRIEERVEQHPLWHEWFKHVKGVGKLLAGQLMGEINIENTPHASALWAYAGLHTMRKCTMCGFTTHEDVPDNKCPYCGGLVIGCAVKATKGQSANANKKLGPIVHKIATQFIKYRGCFYEKIYRKARSREEQENKPFKMNVDFAKGYVLAERIGKFEEGTLIKRKGSNANFDKIRKEVKNMGRNWVLVVRSNKHLHMRALRIVKKLFLSHTWEMWRKVRGLPTPAPYPIEHLGHYDYIPPESVIEHDKKI